MQHPEEGLIHAWIDGALPAAEAAELETHVAGCSECAATVAEARGLVAASSRIIGHLDHVPGNVIPATRSRKLWLRSAWPGAIAATLLVGVGFYATRDTQEPVLPAPTSAVIAPRATDSIPVMPPSAQPEQVATRPTQRRSPQPEVRAMAPANEPPMPDLQKATAASVAPPPPAAPVVGSVGGSARSAGGSEMRLRGLSEVVVTGTSDTTRRAAAEPNDVRAQRAREVAPSVARVQAERSDLAESRANVSVEAFVGCYEMIGILADLRNRPDPARPNIYQLPSRFALVDESAPTAGLLAVRRLDAAGRQADRLVGPGWSIEGDKARVVNGDGKTVLTLSITGSTVRAVGDNMGGGARVISCRK